MQIARPWFAPHPGRFGRAPARDMGAAVQAAATSIGSDLKLFAATFAAGFLFVSILIA